MNQYLKNLSKIEFVVTYACTGRCKHCSEGEHTSQGEGIDLGIAADTVRKIGAEYDIKTVMTFGGEPLLYTEAVYAVMSAAKELNIPRRQVITNGYFSKNAERIREVAERLAECGVNDLLLSVDAFHQETIPLHVVKQFAAEAKKQGIPIRLSPAWLVSAADDNPYNVKTREILHSFDDLELPVGEGNVIFPEGNARKYLAEYFKGTLPANPYAEDPRDVHCLSFEPNGDVLDGNVYQRDILEILGNYVPKKTKKVIVLPYDVAWETAFEEIGREIEAALGDLKLSIEHVGSTSVKGMSAKPCIDIDVVIKDYSVFEAVVQKLNSIGYVHEGDLGIRDREAFKYEAKPHLMKHHLYVCPKDSEELRRHVAFRDFLRQNPEAVKKYSRVKETAARLFPDNMDRYIEYKSPCIEELYRECGLK